MAVITTHATLKAAVAEWLHRADLSGSGVGIDIMIDLAEKRLARDPRVRNLNTANLTVDAEEEAAPSGFRSLEALYHNSAAWKGAIQIMGADALPGVSAKYGLTGVPRAAAIFNANGTFTFRFAPAPDTTYTLKCVFWRTLTALSSGTNWLVASHPDIYLYATLVESAPYLIEDQRIEMWKSELEDRIQALDMETWNQQYAGTMAPQFTPIGG